MNLQSFVGLCLWEFLEIDANGDIWGLDHHHFMFHYDRENWTDYSYRFGPIPYKHWKRSFAIDAAGNKLIGSEAGLTIFNENGIIDTDPRPSQTTEGQLYLYPNPATEQAHVTFFQSEEGPVEINLWTLQGKLVGSISSENEMEGDKTFTIPTGHLGQGVAPEIYL